MRGFRKNLPKRPKIDVFNEEMPRSYKTRSIRNLAFRVTTRGGFESCSETSENENLEVGDQIHELKWFRDSNLSHKMVGVALAIFAAIPLGVGGFSGFVAGLMIPSLKWSLMAAFGGMIATGLIARRVSLPRSSELFSGELFQFGPLVLLDQLDWTSRETYSNFII